MKQPLWAVNSIVILVALVTVAIFYFLQAPIVRKVSVEPDAIVQHQVVQPTITVDIEKIYGTR